jgi:hypothetical protein
MVSSKKPHPHVSNFKPAAHRRHVPRTKAISTWEGWAAFISQLVIAFGFLVFGLTHFAFASSGHDRSDFGRGTDDQMVHSVQVSASGALSWVDGVGKIQDRNSGRTYVLANAEGLESLYESGVHNVVLMGHLTASGALSVESVSTP